jgi:hypothetical protein
VAWHSGVKSVGLELCLYMGEPQMDFKHVLVKVVLWLESIPLAGRSLVCVN